MNSVRNNVQLIGNVGSEPIIKNLNNGKTVAKISLATNRIFRNAKGEKEVRTQWHNLVIWGKQSSLVQKLIQKGSEIAVNGSLHSKIYLDKQGNSRQATEVFVRDFKVMSRKK